MKLVVFSISILIVADMENWLLVLWLWPAISICSVAFC